jgi:hypothetical protein
MLLVGLVPLLAGCWGLPIGGSLSSETVYCIETGGGEQKCSDQEGNTVSPPDEGDAVTKLRAAIPAMEAYYMDNETYAGMTLRKLRVTYDSAISTDVRIPRATDDAYCAQIIVDGETYSYRGPWQGLSPGSC